MSHWFTNVLISSVKRFIHVFARILHRYPCLPNFLEVYRRTGLTSKEAENLVLFQHAEILDNSDQLAVKSLKGLHKRN